MDVPHQPREIHDSPCGPCPSDWNKRNGGDDPESLDIREWYKAGKIPVWDAIFRCAWRREKLCKGNCDFLGVTEADLTGEEAHVL